MSEIKIISKNNNAEAGCHEIANVDGLNLFISNGKAWHGLGWETDRNFTLDDIRDIFPDLLYTVEHRPCFADVGGERIQIKDVNAIIMRMNGFEKFFEARSATDDRPIVQPEETLQLLEDAFSKFGAKFSSVGSLYGGETFFVSAELPEGFQVAGDDHLSYLNATDNFTGQQRFRLFASDHRVVCRNTARSSWGMSEKRISLNHTENMKNRLNEIIEEFEAIVAARPAAIELLKAATKIQVRPDDFINKVLDQLVASPGLGVNVTQLEMADAMQAARNRFPKANDNEILKAANLIRKQTEKRERVFEDILTRYNSPTCETARGSVYSAYQAVTEFANYGLKTRETANQLSNQFMSLAAGKGATLTDVAWRQLQLAATA